MMDFDSAFDRLIGNEGGYSFNSNDPGHETMYGVTAKVARDNGYTGDMNALTRDQAMAIYRRLYWDAMQADQLPPLLRFEAFDAAVNSGVRQATLWLQRAVGTTDDGKLGAATIAAASRANAWRAAVSINGQRLRFMRDQPTWGMFGRGWADRIAGNLLALAAEPEL